MKNTSHPDLYLLKLWKHFLIVNKGFPGGSVVKNLPARQEMWVRILGQEDPLEEEMATHPILLPEIFHGQRTLTGYSPSQDMTEHAHTTRQ